MKTDLDANEAAVRWHISKRQVTKLCANGKIKGAYKSYNRWMIPNGSEKPVDGRTITGRESTKPALPLPIGVSDYPTATTEYYYVDKTLMIKDILDEKVKVSLFTRPRRFGKTLNMDMLRTFFEKTDKDTTIYFKDKKIWYCGDNYKKLQGKYPVIFLTFKDIKFNSWEETYESLKSILIQEAYRHIELKDSSEINQADKEYLKMLLSGNIKEAELASSLERLSYMLQQQHKIAPVIIIDEYDTPIHQGHSKGFYEEIITFMRNLFSGAFKDNSHLSFGFLTGILKIESLIKGIDSLAVNTVLDEKYSQYFGFTKDEIREMTAYYHAEDKYDEILSWYDGYRFGNTDIFNPWSIINYFRNDCQALPYWQSTGNNEIIQEILSGANQTIYDSMALLLQGKSIRTYIDTGVIYPEIKNKPSSVFSFLLVAGYLNVISKEITYTGDYLCEVALPNKEIKFVYNKEILQHLDHYIQQNTVINIQEALYCGNANALEEGLNTLPKESVSYYDTAKENFYHGLMLGLCATLNNSYYLSSNKESGEGRYDISLCPKDKTLPGILIELKAVKVASKDQLKELATKALIQIKENIMRQNFNPEESKI